MVNKRWITVGLAALAIGGVVAAYPFTSSALETSAAALTPAAAAQPAAATTQPNTGATDPQTGTANCGGAGGGMGGMMQGGMMQGGMMNGGMMGAGLMRGTVAETVYKLTGLDKQEIIKQRQAGKSFVEIAKTKGVTEEQLLAAVKKEHQAIIDQRVADGTMTKEMADLCTKNFEANIKTMLENTTVKTKGGRGKGLQGGFSGMMNGMMGRSGGMMGGWGQQAPAAQGQSI